MRLRTATAVDIPAIEALITRSVRALQPEYTEAQRESALGTVFGVDRALIADGTYLVVEVNGLLAACGGWSRRATLFGSDNSPVREERWLDPARDRARIRAFFVAPEFARRGLGTELLQACEAAALAAGFRRFELGATLAGIPLYARHGYQERERVTVPLANGDGLAIVRMEKDT
jgi:GNAT superfamily N-acetyltransferase